MHLCSDKVTLHVVLEAGYAKRICEDTGPVRGIGQLWRKAWCRPLCMSEQCLAPAMETCLGLTGEGNLPVFLQKGSCRHAE